MKLNGSFIYLRMRGFIYTSVRRQRKSGKKSYLISMPFFLGRVKTALAWKVLSNDSNILLASLTYWGAGFASRPLNYSSKNFVKFKVGNRKEELYRRGKGRLRDAWYVRIKKHFPSRSGASKENAVRNERAAAISLWRPFASFNVWSVF